MARKEQIKRFFIALLDESVLKVMIKERKGALKCYTFFRAIKNRCKKLEESLNLSEKELMVVIRKAEMFFKSVAKEMEEVDMVSYLNFLLAFGDDIFLKTTDKMQARLVGEILVYLFKLYLVFDSEMKEYRSMDIGEHLKLKADAIF